MPGRVAATVVGVLTAVVFHPREEWQDPAKPVTGPATREPMRYGVAHYTGTGRTSQPADIPAFLRNLQAVYLRDRGYSLGYSLAASLEQTTPTTWTGHLWEIRGHDINNAANKGGKVEGNANGYTKSILILGNEGVRAPDPLADTVAHGFWLLHDAAGTMPVEARGHGDIEWTGCCGEPWMLDVDQGRFDPAPFTPPEPEDDMAITYADYSLVLDTEEIDTPNGPAKTLMLVGPGGAWALDGQSRDHALARGASDRRPGNPEGLPVPDPWNVAQWARQAGVR